MPVTWCLADPKLGEREVRLDLLTIAVEAGLVAPGATVLADKGLAGRDVEQQIAGLGVRLLRPDRRNEPRRHGSLGGVRQWIESVFDTLKGQLGLEHHGARTAHDVFTRVAQRLLALAAAVWRNWAINAPDKRSLIAYDHGPGPASRNRSSRTPTFSRGGCDGDRPDQVVGHQDF